MDGSIVKVSTRYRKPLHFPVVNPSGFLLRGSADPRFFYRGFFISRFLPVTDLQYLTYPPPPLAGGQKTSSGTLFFYYSHSPSLRPASCVLCLLSPLIPFRLSLRPASCVLRLSFPHSPHHPLSLSCLP